MLVEAQQIVLAAWAVVAAVLLGLGLLERRLFGPPLQRAGELWQVFWVGWAVLLSGLQLWHLVLPVDDRARIAVAVTGLLGWLAAGGAPWRALWRAVPRNALALAAVLACAWWLSNRSLGGPRFGDTGMYLIPTILWYESYAAVPGLANLFVPFGHNLSYFLYAALLDGGPLAGRIYHVVNSVLLIAILARGLLACGRLLRRDAGNVAADLFHALVLIPASELAFGLYLTSPMPDTAVFLFGLVLAGELVELLSAARPSRATLVRIAFLSGAGLTIKLSIAGMCVASAAVALLWWIRKASPSMAGAVRAAALAALAAAVPVATWIARNVISSGYPFYPASLLPLPVDWIARVDATEWIQKPMAMAPLWSIFRDPAWWQTRLLSLGWTEADVLRPLAMIAAGLVVFAVARPLRWWRGRSSPLSSAALVAPLAAFWFCFVNTPMPRYQGATLWIFAVELFVLALGGFLAGSGRVPRIVVVVLVLVGAASPLGRGADPWLQLKNFEITSQARIHSEQLASGLTVNVPENQVCWYAPLPCTPEPHPGLRLREPGNLGRGFAIDLPASP